MTKAIDELRAAEDNPLNTCAYHGEFGHTCGLELVKDAKRIIAEETYRLAIEDARADGFLMPIDGRVYRTLAKIKTQ